MRVCVCQSECVSVPKRVRVAPCLKTTGLWVCQLVFNEVELLVVLDLETLLPIVAPPDLRSSRVRRVKGTEAGPFLQRSRQTVKQAERSRSPAKAVLSV